MIIETLIITNVDIALLEEQRCTLGYIKHNPELFQKLDPEKYDHIRGLSNMLNDWSDQRFYRKSKDINHV